MVFRKQLRHFKPAVMCCLLLLLCPYSQAEIYKWVDKKGKVHLSDKRSAADNAIRIDSESPRTSKDGNTFRFTPDADTLLRENQRAPKGSDGVLSAGFWKSARGVREYTSIIRFDLSDLIAEVNTHPDKKINSALLNLFANTSDNLHFSSNNSDAAKGHYSKKGDNAFYIKAVRNNWDEHNTTWQQYYNDSNYTSSSIRTLPFSRAEGSKGNDSLDYSIDLTEMITNAAKVNMRQITIELRLQRRASMSVVTFYSKEAAEDKKPTLLVELTKK